MKNSYKCDACGESFPKAMDLARHVRWKHGSYEAMNDDGLREFVCDECPPSLPPKKRSFGSAHGLRLHKIRMHGATKRSYNTTKKRQEAVAAPLVSFCPCCGTNIRLFTQALAAIGGLQDD